MSAAELLGQRVAEVDWSEYGGPASIEEIEGEVYVELPTAGLSAVAGPSGLIHTVQFHAAGHDQHAGYSSDLPEGLAFSMGRSTARDLLGPPAASGGGEVIQPFGRTNAWDRWEPAGGPSLHCQYSVGETGLELVTLMTSPPDGGRGNDGQQPRPTGGPTAGGLG